jgi:propionyl-CoA synthetase
MPMVPEAVVAMLACARIGAIHSVVFGGFASKELAERIDHAEPKVIVSASCGFEPGRTIDYKGLLDDAISMSVHKPGYCVILNRKERPCALTAGYELDFEALLRDAAPANCTPMNSADPLYILYTSGTTGAPKGVVRDTGGYLSGLCWSMRNIYGVSPGEVFWAASDIGWVVGHSYIVYGPLVAGCASVLYEGKPVGTPDAGAFWRIIEKHKVSTLFTAPTAIRAMRRADPDGVHIKAYDRSSLRRLFLAGERADAPTLNWIGQQLGIPVIDHWWQTELGWPALATCAGLGDDSITPGSAGRPVPGFAFKVVDSQGNVTASEGALLIETPLPPGCLTTLWRADDRYRQSYLDPFPGHYMTGDAALIDKDGFIHIMGRTDDVINVAGHRLSTASIEEAIAGHPDIIECAVIGAADELKGEVPVAFAVRRAASHSCSELVADELVTIVRDAIGPVASFRKVVFTPALPKTRSGKILRSLLRRLHAGEAHSIPPTIDDPATVDKVIAALAADKARRS